MEARTEMFQLKLKSKLEGDEERGLKTHLCAGVLRREFAKIDTLYFAYMNLHGGLLFHSSKVTKKCIMASLPIPLYPHTHFFDT